MSHFWMTKTLKYPRSMIAVCAQPVTAGVCSTIDNGSVQSNVSNLVERMCIFVVFLTQDYIDTWSRRGQSTTRSWFQNNFGRKLTYVRVTEHTGQCCVWLRDIQSSRNLCHMPKRRHLLNNSKRHLTEHLLYDSWQSTPSFTTRGKPLPNTFFICNSCSW